MLCRLLFFRFLCHFIGFHFFFFFNYPATTEIYTYCHTLSLHDALPILFRLTRALPFLQALHWRAAPTFPFACVSHHRSDRARYVVLDRSSAGRHDEPR